MRPPRFPPFEEVKAILPLLSRKPPMTKDQSSSSQKNVCRLYSLHSNCQVTGSLIGRYAQCTSHAQDNMFLLLMEADNWAYEEITLQKSTARGFYFS
ncbi:hypothetical protein AVEN_33313-1 [Araneus ventricosus]|uniref:Uncharacterized protein n=1 Tax=Araneus ventricosus TaxID=182803 RepID=A0A4Y2QNH1_ARAVE|nr:hypothetical protein AVEN_33313-1 [Araneus ventricosus]